MLPFANILLPNRRKYINFSNPFNGREWLRLLAPHTEYGLTFKPGLNLPPSKLGFSFSTNGLGFRGPSAQSGDNVLMGTSFAMGLSVNDGDNWYDLLLDYKKWLNVGMPVAPQNHRAVIRDHYLGSGAILLYIYHPNVWKTATGFVKADIEGKSIFEILGWKSSAYAAAKAYPTWIAKEIAKAAARRALYTYWDRRPYYFNTRYNWLEQAEGRGFVEQQVAILSGIFSGFQRVIVIRAPIKEDSLPATMRTIMLQQLIDQYDIYWEQFQAQASHPNIKFYSVADKGFDRRHFLPFDTHWSAEGNRHFANAIRPILIGEGVAGIL